MFPLHILLSVTAFHLGFPLLFLSLCSLLQHQASTNNVATLIPNSLSPQAHSRSDWQQPQNATREIPRRYKHKVSHT